MMIMGDTGLFGTRRGVDARRSRPAAAAPVDIEVDVLCIGVDPAVLAVAISAVSARLAVLVVDPRTAPPTVGIMTRSPETSLQRAWGRDRLPETTTAYLNEVTDGLGQPSSFPQESALPRRHLDRSPGRSKKVIDRVAPFFGRELIGWRRACMNSPHGVLYSRSSIPGTNEFTHQSGERIEFGFIGSRPSELMTTSLSSWMVDQARDRGIEIRAVEPLHRFMFHEQKPIGAVFGTPGESEIIGVRHGVALSTSRRRIDDVTLTQAWQCTHGHLGLVSAVASRFGRLEFLTDHPVPLSPQPRQTLPSPAVLR
jgi:hypothetical protein